MWSAPVLCPLWPATTCSSIREPSSTSLPLAPDRDLVEGLGALAVPAGPEVRVVQEESEALAAPAAVERMLSPGVICTSTGPVPAGVRAGRVAQARTGLREDLVTPGPAAPVATAEVEGRQAVAAPGVLMARQVPPRPEVRVGSRVLM